MNTPTVYDEIIDFLAMGSTPAQIIAFKVSEETRERVSDLIQREKTSGLTSEENID